jgi:transposase
MTILGGLDLHRMQITYDCLDTATGEIIRGRVLPATRAGVRSWLERFQGDSAAFALEATTGWRFVVEELEGAGFTAHLADPTEVAARRGRKRRAKTDKADALHLRSLLVEERVPECWIPPAHILELRTQVRLRKTLADYHTAWIQRIHATLFHHGLPRPSGHLLRPDNRSWLDQLALPTAARQAVQVALSEIDHLDAHIVPLDKQLRAFALRQRGCRALMAIYGVGFRTATAILAELGDARRLASSRLAVRYAGLDITVYESDGKRSPGHLSRQGPAVLRWALYEAAQCATRPGSPDHAYYREAKARHDHARACLSVARKLARRAHHTLCKLGDDALAPPSSVPLVTSAA